MKIRIIKILLVSFFFSVKISPASEAKKEAKNTPLIRAIQQNNSEEEIKKLMSTTDVNKRGKNGRTALMIASDKGKKEIVKALLEAQADVNATDQLGRPALLYAKLKNFTEIEKLLKMHGAADSNDFFLICKGLEVTITPPLENEEDQ